MDHRTESAQSIGRQSGQTATHSPTFSQRWQTELL